MILSHAVDEEEDFEPVQKKPRLDSDTEHDGITCISPGYQAILFNIVIIVLHYS